MGLAKDFRDFAIRGNMMDLAVGMIIGAAFTSIVKSLVDDVINPVLGIFTGKIDFGNLFIALDGKHCETLEAATTAGAAVIKYGSFVSALINFIIMALVVFMIVKAVNKMRDIGKKPEPEAAPTTKECPFCKSDIAIAATRCPHCTSIIEEKKADSVATSTTENSES